MWCARLDRDKKRGTTINADTIHSDRNATADVITMSARASGADAFDAAEDPAKGTGNQRLIGGWNGPTAQAAAGVPAPIFPHQFHRP
jgi:hypothetical protein